MHRAWWKEAVAYQIYPRSFMDSDGDGIGDLRGIIGKLDYLKDLGVDVVWLSPVYASPNHDNGYDISDYRDIHPDFGTLADWDALAAGLHARGMKIVMDLVVNYTSDEHPWFRQARSSRDNPYRDHYIWRDGADGRAPNNWASIFGGPTWTFNEATGDYYFHLFTGRQPDLNWDNPEVRAAVFDMMRWWIGRGVDGFRMDAIDYISKDPAFPQADDPEGRGLVFAPRYFAPGPKLMDYYREMDREVLSRHDLMTVGEAALTTREAAAALTDRDTGVLDMVFSFEHVDIDMERHGFATKWHRVPFDLGRLKAIDAGWQEAMAEGGWNSLYLNNHDQPRAVSRFGDDGPLRRETATMLATCLHLRRGTPFVYQGEEIGMANAGFTRLEDYRDVETLNAFRELTEVQGFSAEAAMEKIRFRSRDNARTPMQWDASPNAGFTTGTPWIGVNPDHATVNVAAEEADPESVLAYYRRLIGLRKRHPVMVYGRFDLIEETDPHVYAYTRTDETTKLLVACSYAPEPVEFVLPDAVPFDGHELLIGNYPVAPGDTPLRFTLRPYEARVYRRAPAASPHETRVLAMTQEAPGGRGEAEGGSEVEAAGVLVREAAADGA